MRNLILAVAAAALIAAPGFAFAQTPAPAAAPAKAAPKYDCTKKGNANKAACKAAVVPTTPTTVAAKPAVTTTTTKPATVASKPATTTSKTTTTAGGSMKACAAQWDALSTTQKGVYNTQATTMKSKSGGKLSGYNVWTGQCMKKK